jgi:hypothetical protein
MKLVISEKQLKGIITHLNSNQDLSEEGEGAPESGTSSDGEKKTGATLWTSGATRGAYQLGVTKWADSYKITRGRANPLWEQVLFGPTINPVAVNNALNPNTDTQTKEYNTFWGGKIQIPTDGSVSVGIWDSTKPRGLMFKDAYQDGDFIFWPKQYIDPKTKKTFTKNELAPDEQDLKNFFPDGRLKWIQTKKDNRYYSVILTKNGKDASWVPKNGYFYSDGSKYIPYDPEKYIHISFTTSAWNWLKENWIIVGEIAVSVVAGFLTGGMSLIAQALIQAGVGLAFAGTAYMTSDQTESDKIGFGVGVLIACLPFIPAATKLGVKGPLKSLAKYGDELAAANSSDEILEIISKFEDTDKLLVSRCFKQIPKAEFEKVIKSKLIQGFADEVKAGKILLEKIPGSQLKWWKELLVEVGGALPIVAAGYAYESIQARKEDEKILKEFLGNIGKETPNTKQVPQKSTKQTTQTPNMEKPTNDDPLGLFNGK